MIADIVVDMLEKGVDITIKHTSFTIPHPIRTKEEVIWFETEWADPSPLTLWIRFDLSEVHSSMELEGCHHKSDSSNIEASVVSSASANLSNIGRE